MNTLALIAALVLSDGQFNPATVTCINGNASFSNPNLTNFGVDGTIYADGGSIGGNLNVYGNTVLDGGVFINGSLQTATANGGGPNGNVILAGTGMSATTLPGVVPMWVAVDGGAPSLTSTPAIVTGTVEATNAGQPSTFVVAGTAIFASNPICVCSFKGLTTTQLITECTGTTTGITIYISVAAAQPVSYICMGT